MWIRKSTWNSLMRDFQKAQNDLIFCKTARDMWMQDSSVKSSNNAKLYEIIAAQKKEIEQLTAETARQAEEIKDLDAQLGKEILDTFEKIERDKEVTKLKCKQQHLRGYISKISSRCEDLEHQIKLRDNRIAEGAERFRMLGMARGKRRTYDFSLINTKDFSTRYLLLAIMDQKAAMYNATYNGCNEFSFLTNYPVSAGAIAVAEALFGLKIEANLVDRTIPTTRVLLRW